MNISALSSYFSKLPVGKLTSEASILTGPQQLFLMLVLLFIFLYGISVGKTRAILSLLAIYVAYMLTVTFPFMDSVNRLNLKFPEYLLRVGVFVFLYVGSFIVLSISSLKHRLSLGEISISKVFLVSLFQVGFLTSIISSLVPIASIPKTIAPLYPYLGTAEAVFVWAVAAIIVLPFMKTTGRHSE